MAPDESSRCYCICSQGQPGSCSLAALIIWCWNLLLLQDGGNSPGPGALVCVTQSRAGSLLQRSRNGHFGSSFTCFGLPLHSYACFHILGLHTGLYMFSAHHDLHNSLLKPPILYMLCSMGSLHFWWDRKEGRSRHCWMWASLLLSLEQHCSDFKQDK